MRVARHGTGPPAAVRALLSQVHPVFMLPPLAASAFGAVLAGTLGTAAVAFDPGLAGLHLVAAFFALYVAHVKDGYVDFHVRDEDDDHPLTAPGCRLALLGGSVCFFVCTAAIALVVGPIAALLTLPGWVIGYHHAPQLDMNPVTTTTGYPLGVGFALLGGYYVQATSLSPTVLGFFVVFVVVLSGIIVVDDSKDYEYDRSIHKRTVAVVLGRERARLAAYVVMGTGLLVVLVLAALSIFPPSTVLAAAAFGVVAFVARKADDELATMLLIRGSFVFLAVLVVAVWLRPLSS